MKNRIIDDHAENRLQKGTTMKMQSATMKCLISLALFIAGLFAGPNTASAAPIIIDPSVTTGTNSITTASGNPLGSSIWINQLDTAGGLGQSIADMKDIAGNATGFTATVTTAFAGSNTAGFWPVPGSDAAIFRGSLAGTDMGADSGVNNAPSVITLSNLDSSQTYNFTFYAGRSGNANYSTLMTVAGANSGSTEVQAAGNNTDVGVVSGISPNGSQEITITFDLGVGNTNYFYANALQMEVIPEPSSMALLAMGAAAVFRKPRRRR